MAALIGIDGPGGPDGFTSRVLDGLYEVSRGGEGLADALDRLRAEASAAIRDGVTLIVISDRGTSPALAPVPSLLATGAVHHHLIREKTRTRVGLLVESGDVREVHHVALLLGYGASAVCPYLTFASVDDMVRDGRHGLPTTMEPEKARANLVRAFDQGLLKIMSKMGISTVASYTGAQIFEAIGLGTVSYTHLTLPTKRIV